MQIKKMPKEKLGLELLKEKIEIANNNMIEAVNDLKSARDKIAKSQEVFLSFFKFVSDLQQAEIDGKERGI